MAAEISDLLNAIHSAERPYDISLILKAYEFAKTCHSDQKRLSGEPYITHPIGVSLILLDMGMDSSSIAAGLLHDVIEDTKTSKQDICETFGEDIAFLVDGATKLKNVPLHTQEEQQIENLRKMLLAMSRDIRVIIIKLADRLYNMRTADAWPEQKRRDKSLETMEIYAPLAQRLGMTTIKEELEDISFRYLDPIAYDEITEVLKQKHKLTRSINFGNKTYIEYIEQKVHAKVKDMVSRVKTSGRIKSHYGIYRKVYMKGKDWDEVFDIYAIRIIVNTVLECYSVLGAMHDMFTPIPNRFKDYISTPKPNMYQSLHTTVIASDGIPFEIQIRTFEMHYVAEYGIAAHWKYKQGIEKNDDLAKKMAWIRHIIELQQEVKNTEDLINSIKTDIGSEEVFVLTPNGEVKSLPVGSTIIDFAYLIHSEIGNKMIGGKINGKIAPIETKLKTNQVVEIITTKSASHGPSRNWLNIVKTTEAKNKIKAWFKKKKRPENIRGGINELKKELLKNDLNLDESEFDEFFKPIATRYQFNSVEDFYAAIGYGGVIVSKMMPNIKKLYFKYNKNESSPRFIFQSNNFSSSTGVVVDGIDHCLVSLAKCCGPIPGNNIVGFITRGSGVSVHKTNCQNILNAQKDSAKVDRFIPVYWQMSPNNRYISTLQILAVNSDEMIFKTTSTLSKLNVPISELNVKFLENENIKIDISIFIRHVSDLKDVIWQLKKLDGIISVDSKS